MGGVEGSAGLVEAGSFTEDGLGALEEAGVLDGDSSLAGNGGKEAAVVFDVEEGFIDRLDDDGAEDLIAIQQGDTQPGLGWFGIAQANETDTQLFLLGGDVITV